MHDLPVGPGLAIVALLLFLNALFVAAEFSYVSVRRTQMQRLAADGNRRAGRVLGALTNLDYYVAASQLGITIASVVLGAIGEPVIAGLIEPPIESVVGSFAPAIAHSFAIACAFLLVTALHMVFGEFVPKTIALQRPVGTTLWLAAPMAAFVAVFGPAITALNSTGNWLLKLLGFHVRPIGDELLAAEDLAMTLESSVTAGLISRQEFDLARNTLALSTLSAADLMTPRGDIVAIAEQADRREVFDVFARNRHTRYPVYQRDIDDIIGVVDAKQIVLDWTNEQRDWRASIQPPLVLPETVTVEQIVTAAQSEGATLIVLADEYGGTAGLVSVFDIVEFLAGELPDEFTTEPEGFTLLPNGDYQISGLASLVDLAMKTGVETPEIEAHTIGGLMMERLQRIPAVGDQVRLDGYWLRVTAMDGQRVDQLRMTRAANE